VQANGSTGAVADAARDRAVAPPHAGANREGALVRACYPDGTFSLDRQGVKVAVPNRPRIALRRLAAVFAGLVLGLAASPAAAPVEPGAAARSWVEDELLVKFRPEASSADRGRALDDLGAVRKARFHSGAEHWKLGRGRTLRRALDRLRADPRVLYAEPNYRVRVADVPNDPLFAQQWEMLNTGQGGGTPGADIRATQAWQLTTGSPDVVVAIIDTGVDATHPDLAPNIWTNPGEIPDNGIDDDGNGYVDDVHGWDFANHDNDPDDDVGHGTHVAGTIAAVGDNGIGVAGVAWHVRIMPLKFLSGDGTGTTADAIAAIDYAVAMGARIANNSWGGGDFSQAMLDAIQEAADQDVLFVAAAGNAAADTDTTPFFPAGYDAPNILSVAASDRNDQLASFSNYGATTVDLAAPGVEILSTLRGGIYGIDSGTSMAAPHVSGAAALILSVGPHMDVGSLRQRILDQTDPVPALAGKVASGGRLDASIGITSPDTTPPGAILDLRVTAPLSNGVVLAWTATGDDGDAGTATAYDVRFATAPITADTFDAAARYPAGLHPAPSGTSESLEIDGLQTSTTYWFAVEAKDEWGNRGSFGSAVEATTLAAPVIDLSPASTSLSAPSGQTATGTITVRNTGAGTLDWIVPDPQLRPHVAALGGPSPDAWGGPDDFGYAFIDSDEPDGPIFSWRDISTSGTPAAVEGDDVISQPIPLGFAFPFYGGTFTGVRVCSNGFLSFADAEARYVNLPLPGQGAPYNLIAPFWTDLFVLSPGDVVTLAEPHAFTVQWTGVLPYGGTQPYTFQAVLQDTGTIVFQYLAMQGPTSQATVGIQNGSGTEGLAMAFDQPYVHDGLAVRIATTRRWLRVSPNAGRLAAGEAADIALLADASDLLAGTYMARLTVTSNDPVTPQVAHSVDLEVTDAAAIAVDPAVVDFGTVYAGYGGARTLAVRNSGSLGLDVLSAAAPDASVTLDPAPPFALAPGESRTLAVGWTPPVPGTLRTTLRVLSTAANAPDVAVLLLGTALGGPRLTAEPAMLDVSLPPGGTADRSITVRNDGQEDLDFTVTARSLSGAPGDIERLPSSPVPLTCVVGDPATGDLYAQENQGTRFYRFDAAALTWQALAPSPVPSGDNGGAALLHGRIYTAYAGDPRLGVYDIAAGTWNTRPSPLGSGTADIASDGESFLYLALGSRFLRFNPDEGRVFPRRGKAARRRPNDTLHGRALRLWNAPDFETLAPPPISFSPRGGLAFDRGRLTGHEGNGGLLAARYDVVASTWAPVRPLPHGGVAGSTIDPATGDYFAYGPGGGATLYRLGSNTGGWTASDLPFPIDDGGLAWLGTPAGCVYFVEGERGTRFARLWLSPGEAVSTGLAGGRVPAGGSLDVALHLDASGFLGGGHETDLVFQSNDPGLPERLVPVRLTVEGAPRLRVSGRPVELESFLDVSTAVPSTIQALTPPVPPGGAPGWLKVTAEGSFGIGATAATVRLDGMVVGVIQAAEAGCAPAVGVFPIASDLLAQAAADGRILVEVENGGSDPSACPVHRDSLLLTYEASSEPLDFGVLFPGMARTLSIRIDDVGNAPLTVAAMADRPECTPDAATLDLAPGEGRLLSVTCSTSVEGVVDATLRLVSNDSTAPEVDLPLHVETRVAPIADVSPPTDAATVPADQDVTHRLTIGNRGGSPLTVALSARSRPEASPGCEAREALVTQSSGELSRIDLATGAVERVAYVHDPWIGLAVAPDGAGAYVTEFGSGVIERIALDTGATVVAAGGVTHGALALSPDGLTLYRSEPAAGVLRAQDVASGAVFTVTSGLNQPGDLAVSADGASILLAETGAGRLVRVDVATGATATVAPDSGVIAGLDVDRASGLVFVSVPARHQVLAIDPATGASTIVADVLESPQGVAVLPHGDVLVVESVAERVLRVDGNSGAVSVVAQNLIGPAGLALLPPRGCGSPVIGFDPLFATVPAGATEDIATILSAAGVGGGAYSQEVDIATNDPARPEITVPVTLTIAGAPLLDLGGDDLAVSSTGVFTGPGAITQHTLQVAAGPVVQARLELDASGDFSGRDMTATLTVDGQPLLALGGTGLSCSTATLERTLPDAMAGRLLTQGSIPVTVRNAPSVTSSCADNRHSVTLLVSQRLEALDFGSVPLGFPVTRSVLLANRGTANLTVSSVSTDLPEVSATVAVPFVLPPGDALRVLVTLRPDAPGPLAGSLSVGSDDPSTPVRVVPIRATVATAAPLAAKSGAR
jgi:subtilisin family serine protease/sugar lactone lactonase YvrE